MTNLDTQDPRRGAERVYINIPIAKLRQQAAHAITVVVRDLSRTGFRAEWPHPATPGKIFWLTLPGLAPISAKAVWIDNFVIGFRFDVPIHEAVFQRLLAKDLMR